MRSKSPAGYPQDFLFHPVPAHAHHNCFAPRSCPSEKVYRLSHQSLERTHRLPSYHDEMVVNGSSPPIARLSISMRNTFEERRKKSYQGYSHIFIRDKEQESSYSLFRSAGVTLDESHVTHKTIVSFICVTLRKDNAIWSGVNRSLVRSFCRFNDHSRASKIGLTKREPRN